MISAAEGWRLSNAPELPLVIAIGSSNRPESMENPWSTEEREEMLRAWLDDKGGYEHVRIVAIPDIEDPPNWVAHAEKYHGFAGIFFTSDLPSAGLYETAGWQVVMTPLEQRERFEGWRVRVTAQMMSTIDDDEAVRAVLSHAVPTAVVEHLIETQGLRRLAFLGEGGEPVG
jgi:nicotinamide mononucleotide adenylyltransferase